MAACGWLYLLPKTIGNVQSDSHVYCELYCKRSGIVSICMNLTNYENRRKLLFIEESELISTHVLSVTWKASVGLRSLFYLKSHVFLIFIRKVLEHSSVCCSFVKFFFAEYKQIRLA